MESFIDPDIYGRGFDSVHGKNAEEETKRLAWMKLLALHNMNILVQKGEFIDHDIYGRTDPRIFGRDAHIETRSMAIKRLIELQKSRQRKRALKIPAASSFLIAPRQRKKASHHENGDDKRRLASEESQKAISRNTSRNDSLRKIASHPVMYMPHSAVQPGTVASKISSLEKLDKEATPKLEQKEISPADTERPLEGFEKAPEGSERPLEDTNGPLKSYEGPPEDTNRALEGSEGPSEDTKRGLEDSEKPLEGSRRPSPSSSSSQLTSDEAISPDSSKRWETDEESDFNGPRFPVEASIQDSIGKRENTSEDAEGGEQEKRISKRSSLGSLKECFDSTTPAERAVKESLENEPAFPPSKSSSSSDIEKEILGSLQKAGLSGPVDKKYCVGPDENSSEQSAHEQEGSNQEGGSLHPAEGTTGSSPEGEPAFPTSLQNSADCPLDIRSSRSSSRYSSISNNSGSNQLSTDSDSENEPAHSHTSSCSELEDAGPFQASDMRAANSTSNDGDLLSENVDSCSGSESSDTRSVDIEIESDHSRESFVSRESDLRHAAPQPEESKESSNQPSESGSSDSSIHDVEEVAGSLEENEEAESSSALHVEDDPLESESLEELQLHEETESSSTVSTVEELSDEFVATEDKGLVASS